MFKEEDVFTVIITALYTFFIASVISHILIFICILIGVYIFRVCVWL